VRSRGFGRIIISLRERDVLKGTAAIGRRQQVSALFAARPASADDDDAPEGRQAGPPLRYSRRFCDVDGPQGRGDFVQAYVLVEGKKILAVGANLRRRRRRCDRRPRAHRHARLHRYAPSPVRDGAAQLPRRRGADQTMDRARRAAAYHLTTEYVLLKFRDRVPAAGRLQHRAVRRALPARRRRPPPSTTSRRSITNAAALRRRRPGAVRQPGAGPRSAISKAPERALP